MTGGQVAIVIVILVALIATAVGVSIALVYKEKPFWDYTPPARLPVFNWRRATSFHAFHETDISGTKIDFSDYKGSEVTVVFAASTKMLMKSGACRDLVPKKPRIKTRPKLLFFPCNEFYNLDNGISAEHVKPILTSCNFAMLVFDKVQVQGEKAYPLWQWLTTKASETVNRGITEIDRVEFLINGEGEVYKRTNVPKASA